MKWRYLDHEHVLSVVFMFNNDYQNVSMAEELRKNIILIWNAFVSILYLQNMSR
jgi:surface polysaccharide O-acyltransferase-like enzyme